MTLLENYSLKSLNTFGLDVRSRWYVEVSDAKSLQSILNDDRFKSVNKLVLGGGSNILFAGDFQGLIIRNRIEHITIISENDHEAFINVGAGVSWHAFVLFTIEHNLPGIENLSFIPGCVGAAPIQNIGAYGVELKNTFHELNALNLEDGSVKIFSAKECRFGYRDSIFKQEAKNRFAIINVVFRFNKKDTINTSYGAIEDQLKKMDVQKPTIRDVSNAVIKIRKSKLPDPEIIGNAGSFFKNPEISIEQFNRLKVTFPEITGYNSSDDKIKIAAGWLIEQSGWKGKRVGNAGMHSQQALVLVNYGNATGAELIDHAERVRKSVMEKFGIALEIEVNII